METNREIQEYLDNRMDYIARIYHAVFTTRVDDSTELTDEEYRAFEYYYSLTNEFDYLRDKTDEEIREVFSSLITSIYLENNI